MAQDSDNTVENIIKAKPDMAQQLVQKKKTDAPLAFFFLYLYTVSVLIRPHEFSYETSDYFFIRIFTIIALMLVLVSLRPIRFLPQHLMLFCLLPIIVFSGFLNGSGMIGVDNAEKFITNAIIPFFLFSVCITSLARQRAILYVCIAAGLMMVYNGYLQHQSFDGLQGYGLGRSISVGGLETRITYLGFFGDPNDLGMFLVMNLPILAYFYYESGTFKKLFYLTILCIYLYGIYITGSRGTMLGAIGVVSVYFLLSKAGIKLIFFAVASAPIAATLLTRFGGLTTDDESASQRLEAWYDGILMLLDNPLFGIGMGQFAEEHGRVAHNSYIHIAAELGILGYSLWGGVLALSMVAGYLLMKKYRNWHDDSVSEKNRNLYAEESRMNQTIFFSMIGFMITAFFLSRNYTVVLYIFIGMLTATNQRLINIRPELGFIFENKMVILCVLYSWFLVVTVYLALKVGL